MIVAVVFMLHMRKFRSYSLEVIVMGVSRALIQKFGPWYYSHLIQFNLTKNVANNIKQILN